MDETPSPNRPLNQGKCSMLKTGYVIQPFKLSLFLPFRCSYQCTDGDLYIMLIVICVISLVYLIVMSTLHYYRILPNMD